MEETRPQGANQGKLPPPSRGYWGEAWRRFRRRKLAMLALLYVIFLVFVAISAPFIVGTKPIVCRYKGSLYFPALSYFNSSWENVIFFQDKFRGDFVKNLKNDPGSWAIWPLVYQDPYRRLKADEFDHYTPRTPPEEPPPVEDSKPAEGSKSDSSKSKSSKSKSSKSKSSKSKSSKSKSSKSKSKSKSKEENWVYHPANPIHDQGAPNRFNLFGTTPNGVDVFAIAVHGTTTSLLVGFVSMGIAATIGIIMGAIAGYLGRFADLVISRIIDVFLCIPTLVLILGLVAILDRPTIWHMMVVIGITSWTSIARLTRAEFIKLKQTDFVAAAEALGAGNFRIMFRYMLPNALAPVLVPITFGIAAAILIEASLSFLGFGSPPPTPSWGALLKVGQGNLNLWWLVVFPGTMVFLTVLAYNLIGEALQDVTDPRLRSGKD